MSKEATTMFSIGVGYRNEDVFGEGFTDIEAVSVYETFELRNQDIPETILENTLLIYN